MKNKYEKHVFICTNHRDASNKKSCGEIGVPLRAELKKKDNRKKIKP